MKADQGKIKMSLVDPDFVLGLSKILTIGAEKYEPNNWKRNTELSRYRDSTLRHLYAYLSGELLDPETQEPHLDHLSANIMFLRYFEHGDGAIQKEYNGN